MTTPPSIPVSSTSSSKGALLKFAANVAGAIRSMTDEEALVRQVRQMLIDAIPDETFSLDCLEEAIDVIQPPLSGWVNPPIVNDEANAFSIRLIYWPPHFLNSAHEHTFWTVTGVFSNALTFRTYSNSGQNDQGFQVDREIKAKRGEVGYILPPCIHTVANEGDTPSISIHVFSGPKLNENSFERGHTTWYPTEGSPDPSPMFTLTHAFQAMISLLGSLQDPRALDLLDRIFAVASAPTRLACAKAIARRDKVRAGHRLLELAEQCTGEDAVKLHKLGTAFRLGSSK
ncbi:MAG TPA: hypothetical protein VHV32_14620 [Candidatus Angelobacter sp.]|jgi:predicted metal-dependent enzyme (double-stranded beta helix superfamily)|nr:hypothetical protein [Candidatus Angelobacter sp.]